MLAGALVVGAAHAFATDETVKEILRQRVEVSNRGVGYVVGMVDSTGARVVSFGRATRGAERPIDGDTVFEVGSVTKVFTSLLLAQMAEAGEVRLEDPIALYVPPTVTTPRAKEITLLQLSRHTAGFISFADELQPVYAEDNDGEYTNERMFAFLDQHPMRSASGIHHSYSSYGAALLGELLARRAGTDFESALRTRILEPLGMTSSGFALTPELWAVHATGHTSRGNPRRLGSVSGMLGSGALRSTANDMVRFLQAHLGFRDSRLASALRATQRTEADRQRPDLPMGLGWFHSEFAGTRIVSHSGATPGFNAFVGMDVESRRGVVVLANSDNDVTNLGRHLLEPNVPLHMPEPPRQFTAIPMDPSTLDWFVGGYRIPGAEADAIDIRREGAQLLLVTPRGTRKVFAESHTTFFAEDMEDWCRFTRDATGRVDGMTWYRENWQQYLKRVR